jgi:hypothetical protein
MTGETTLVGPLNAPNFIIDIACNLAGEMYGYDLVFVGSSSLYSINKETGETTVIGPMGVGFIYAQDCCFDRDNDILYIAGYTNTGELPGLYTCDVSTGAVILVGMLMDEVDALSIPYQTSNWTLQPHANFTWSPPMPFPGETILFNASMSHDDDGYITLYEWDWNDDGVYEESHTTPTATHSWASPGSYTVTLRVTDNADLTGKKTKTVEIINQPPEPPIINGPTNGTVNVAYTFTIGPITDPEGDSMYCIWDWGDGNITEWLGPCDSGQIITATHLWTASGVYAIKAKLKDTYGAESNWSETHIITIVEIYPPTPPIITGPANGKPGINYEYTFNSTDISCMDLMYMIEWGDGTESIIMGPSGTETLANHTWTKKGTYVISAKSKNAYGWESDWGTLPVKIPTSDNLPIISFFEWLLKQFPHAFPLLHMILNHS